MDRTTAGVYTLLEQVKDPEIPVVHIVEMGMITGVACTEEYTRVDLTPTFVGCPAIDYMRNQIVEKLQQAGYTHPEVRVNREVAWNSDRMTAEAKEKIARFGLAPPPPLEGELTEELLNKVKCPHCGSPDTTLRSPFGSTLCRAIRFCFTCRQGFEQFKPVQ